MKSKFFLFFLPALACGFFCFAAEKKFFPADGAMPENLVFGIPKDTDLEIARRGFTLGYSRKHRQSLWVSYILTAEEVRSPQVKRTNRFLVDPVVDYRPVTPKDYTKTGFDRGHLAPAADMGYSVETMKNSFYMSNISPQLPGCNRGIWKRIESQVRAWAVKEKKLCIVTGPIFPLERKNMKGTDIPVPCAFYKIVYDMTPPCKMIAFLVPNEASKRHISNFAVPVDEIETVTGYDFFSELPQSTQKKLERKSDFHAWPQ